MKKYIDAINYNIKYIFFYEFIFKLISLLIGIPFIKVICKFIINHYDIKYISIYNLQFLFNHWDSCLILAGILLFTSLYFIFDTSMIILLVHKGLDKRDVNYLKLIKESLLKTIKVFIPKNILYLIYPFIYILFMYLGIILITYYYTDYTNILIHTILRNYFPVIFIFIVLALFIFLFIKGLYALHDYIIEDKSFISSLKTQSAKNNIRDIFILILRKVFSFIIILISINLLARLFFYVKDNIPSVLVSSILEGSIISLFIYILYYYIIKSQVNDILYLSYRYYYYRNERVSAFKDKPVDNDIFGMVKWIIKLLFTIICIVIMYQVNTGKIKYEFIFKTTVDITAHRGASKYAPENSMSAFNKAYEIGAEYIELDVHESKDGYIYVMHDGSLSRTLGLAGLDKDTKWADIKDKILKSKFDEYQEEHVPLLEDVLKWAKDKDVILNIELKPSAKSVNLSSKVAEYIHKYKMEDKVVVASFNTDAVLKVKELNDKIEVVYLGDYYMKYDNINTYSINYAGITREVVEEIHGNNGTIYAWTIDTPDIVKTMINMGVDNIITNDPIMVQNVLKDYKTRNKTNVFFNFIFYIF